YRMICTAKRKLASSRRKKTATEQRCSTSDNAQTTGLRCRITMAAVNTATMASAQKDSSTPLTRSSSHPSPQDDGGRPHDVHQRERQHHLPSQAHELVVPEARQGPPHPDVQEEEAGQLGQ